MAINQFSDKFMEKFMQDSGMQSIAGRSLIKTWYYYIIDSTERIQKRLDLFLKEQLENPAEELIELSKQFLKIKNPDERIVAILKFVCSNVKYSTDQTNFGKTEKWANALETWNKRKDDCDGINALVYILARLSGITDLCLYSIIGDTGSGGHYWNVYFSPKLAKWVSIDGTYFPNFQSVAQRPPFLFTKEKYIAMWFMFNEQFILKQK